jgi:hypothetical protein
MAFDSRRRLAQIACPTLVVAEWAVVRTGLLAFAQSCAARRGKGGGRRTPGALQVKEAPNIEPDGQLSEVEEASCTAMTGSTTTP